MSAARTRSSAGKRRAEVAKEPRSPRRLLRGLAVAGLLAAWLLLVIVAIAAGRHVRGGTAQAWWALGAATVAAVAVLFVALMLLMGRIWRTSPAPASESAVTPPAGGAAAPPEGRHSRAH